MQLDCLMNVKMCLYTYLCLLWAVFVCLCRTNLSSQASRLLAAAMRSTTEVRKSLGSFRVALPS